MDIQVSFPGGKRVDAQVGQHAVRTDQPEALGGGNVAPAPFDLFLASLATCAGIYVLGFCQSRSIATDGMTLVQHATYDPTGRKLERVTIEIQLPAGFPEKYRASVVQAAAGCKVKRLLESPPELLVRAA